MTTALETKPTEGLNTAIYAELRSRLVSGRMTPGQELSTRTLAAEMGVSQTPVRDALSRLAADGAVSIRSKRRVLVPRMTPERFNDLMRCRMLLEPEAASLALPFLDKAQIDRLKELDAAMEKAIAGRDAETFMRHNHAFHFALYRAQPGKTLAQVIETLWLQSGPFMRVVFEKLLISAQMNHHHRSALTAIASGDAKKLREAIAADISEGMGMIASKGFASAA